MNVYFKRQFECNFLKYVAANSYITNSTYFSKKIDNGKAYQTSIPNFKISPKSKPFLNMRNHNHVLKIKTFDKIEDPSRQWSRAHQIPGERVG